MSTNSTISVVSEDGSVKSIYGHYDGYLSYVGKMLVNHYNSYEKVMKLIELGNLSQLKETVETSIFYGRDRQEEDEKADVFWDEDMFYLEHGPNQEYNYLFKEGNWYLVSLRSRKQTLLTVELCEASDD